jgi:membrane-associated phospholipid phosphatase
MKKRFVFAFLAFLTNVFVDSFVHRLHPSQTRGTPTKNQHINPPPTSPSQSVLTHLAKISANGADDTNVNMALSVIGSTTSALVSVVFFCVLAWKRDALMVTFFIGSILNGIVSKVLKKIIGESRPPELETFAMNVKPSDGGMPSSHAMSLGFIGAFTGLQLPWTRPPLALYVLLSLMYRVAVNLHTPAQIAVGLVLGASSGTVWYYLCQGIFGFNPMDFVAAHLLNQDGLLPWPALVVPVIVGAAVVGSFERRISLWVERRRLKIE